MKEGTSDLPASTGFHMSMILFFCSISVCEYVYQCLPVLVCVYIHYCLLKCWFLFFSSIASGSGLMPSFCRVCLIQQDVVCNGKGVISNEKLVHAVYKQPPAWLLSNNSLSGKQNYSSESDSEKVEEAEKFVVDIHCNICCLCSTFLSIFNSFLSGLSGGFSSFQPPKTVGGKLFVDQPPDRASYVRAAGQKRCLAACWWPCCCSCCVFQLRRWRGWQPCALIRWFQAHTRLPFGGGANLPPWDVCSNPGNGGRRRVKSSSRLLQVRTVNTTLSSPSSPPLPL